MPLDPDAFPSAPDRLVLILTLLVLAALGLTLLATGLRRIAAASHLRHSGTRAQAEVVAARLGVDTRGRVRQRVLYRVMAPSGPQHALSVGPHLHRHRPGSTTTVLVDPEHPDHPVADEPLARLAPGAALAGSGLALLVAAAVLVVPNL